MFNVGFWAVEESQTEDLRKPTQAALKAALPIRRRVFQTKRKQSKQNVIKLL